MFGDVGMDLRLADLIRLLAGDDVVNERKVAIRLGDDQGLLYLRLEREEREGDQQRWLLVDSTEASLLSKLKREIKRRKDAEASIAFLKGQPKERVSREERDVDVASLEMQLSGEGSSRRDVIEMKVLKQEEKLAKMRKQRRIDLIIASGQRESNERLAMHSEELHVVLLVLNDQLISSTSSERSLQARVRALEEDNSALVAERNNLRRRCESGAKALSRALKMAKESREDAEAFKGAVERLVDVMSLEEDGNEEEEEDEEEVERPLEVMGICR